ncbi:sugar MFS transporter [Geothrix sp. PMB-07]|uniref:MFS transporter n=1 Tax=Geothrix sp. PMB-07 TaxID=3068640 RepID=UPI002741DA79|nr:MFS transporter [Geothrix sp. PMB-07]WLT31891.1 MFS transporter [Geothrix sp. PMB-07]
MTLKSLPIFLAFLLMGVADAMGPLSSAVSANPVMAALMPFFVFIAFAFFSVPAGVLATRIGKKKLLLAGLGLNVVAVAVPTFLDPPFPLLLFCIFLLGVGTTLLQVAGNPIMRDVSAPGAYSRNLALAQGIKGVGSTASAYLVTAISSLAVFAALSWRAAFPVFFALMLVALLSVSTLRIEESPAEHPPSVGSCLALLKVPVFAQAVLGIFLYVGAEVCMGTFLKPAFIAHGYAPDRAALLGPALFFGALTAGRLVAGLLKVSAQTFLRISATLGTVGLALLMTGLKAALLPAVVLGGLGFANIWPMLFALTVEEDPVRASELSGLMCMAISGGAVLPLLMGRLGGGASPLAFIVPLGGFAFLLFLSLKGGRRTES